MDIPPYDGKEYRYCDRGASAKEGRQRVASLLGLPQAPSAAGLRFDLSFYSGGIGVFDQLAISIIADTVLWATVRSYLSAKTPIESANDVLWSEEFVWLVCGEETFPSIDDAAVSFINSQRKDFQDQCTPDMTVFFHEWSNVNDWAVVWGTDARLNYLGFSQG